MPGPRTYTTVLGGEGRRSPQNLSRNGPGVQRCRKCETSPPPYPDAKPGLLQSVAPHRLPRIAAILRAHRWSPELEERSSGKTEPRRSIRIRAGHNGLPLLKRLLGPSFPRLPPSGHFTGPGVKPGRAPCPQPPPVLSLGTPAALPHSSIAPGRHPLLHHLRAWLVYAAPCFLSILSLSAQRSGGKAQTKKPPPRNFPAMRPCTKSSKTLMNPLLLLQPRTHGLEPSGSNVPYARLYGAVGWGG